MTCLFFLVLIGLIVGYVYWTQQSQKTEQAWREAGRVLGLTYEPGRGTGSRTLFGRVDGYAVMVTMENEFRGSSNQTYTRFFVRYPELDVRFRLQTETLMSSVRKAVGENDILVGDLEFDNLILVQGPSPDDVRAFLTPMRRERLLRAFRNFSKLLITSSRIECPHVGPIREPERIVRYVRAFVRIAEVLHAHEDSILDDEPEVTSHEFVPPLPTVLGMAGSPAIEVAEAQDEDEAFDAAEAPPPIPELVDDEPFATVPREDPVDDAPTDSSEDVLPVAEEAVAEEHPAEQDDDTLTDVASTCEELFRPDVMSSDVTQLFEERFEGRTVRWTASLERLEDFTWDLQFGDGPGTKALVRLHEVGDTYGTREIRGVVQLPRDVAQTLQSRKGEPITFEGRLHGCDPFMRNLFVAEAKLVG